LRLVIAKTGTLDKQQLEKQFERDIKEHELLILKVCRIYARTDADRQDLFQEIVIQLWKAYPKFRGQSKFSTFLYRIAIYTAISGLRRQHDIIETREPDNLPHHSDNSTSAGEEQLGQLYAAIAQLSEIEKAIVMLYMEDKTYKDMEDILGISEGSLRTKMTRIKDKLRELTKN